MNTINKWRPSASLVNLFHRAKIIAKIRRFFYDRAILEVETPAMSQATVTDINISSFETFFLKPEDLQHISGLKLWLITSPEYHMKRLLAAGSGPIYQLCRSFRNQEYGRYHNPEFTILEWYQPHYNMHRLMTEVNELLQAILYCPTAETCSYQTAFLRYLDLDPLSADNSQLRIAAEKLGLNNLTQNEKNRDTILQLLFINGIEKKISTERPVFIYNFPATQAALAVLSKEDNRVAERFEVYFKGIELANGFCELTDADEQRQRFERDNYERKAAGLSQKPIDTYFLGALIQGMPESSGVALGVDRLIMLALKAEKLSDVIAFPVDRC
ncbi:elongation factor P--(R)-beta-lysine ligase [Candidatus Erwinia haradaeae]|uniref:Elongation factor P--(R)-beta-lysine ligase n=1 Tax=Candidatus Erwinia haradaeae TaxID=1922217 RepID=A0A451DI37_9GAMM|nr:elongation factor P--(R)-beta-lysine ligase [Candidatus Erwinia haradaeae]VFP86330.1 Elongation factor P--(R)-beta-lysine ligase [Candidatus Erwinia haradaeae]